MIVAASLVCAISMEPAAATNLRVVHIMEPAGGSNSCRLSREVNTETTSVVYYMHLRQL